VRIVCPCTSGIRSREWNSAHNWNSVNGFPLNFSAHERFSAHLVASIAPLRLVWLVVVCFICLFMSIKTYILKKIDRKGVFASFQAQT
jgi:hypothetical protein